jgi:Family of unknown function (DUF5329)
MKKLLLILFLMYSGASVAAEISAATNLEISHLFSYLENSGCQFNRNGSWYTSKEAVDHIDKKFQYLRGKNLISTTESFIENAASKSSMSGKQYLVKCSDGIPTESAAWFLAELVKYRKIAH